MLNNIKNIIKSYLRATDLPLIGITLLCAIYGIVLVASATHSFGSNKTLYIQIAAALVGFVIMILLSLIDYELFNELWIFVLAASMLALIVTIFIGTGPTDSTNRNWIDLGPINIQPSEFIKLTYILVLSSLISKFGEDINEFKNICTIGGILSLILIPLLLTGDTGMAIVYLFITLIMLFIAGLKLRYFAIIFGGGAVLFPIVWKFVFHQYQRDRILYGFMPELDPLNIGYQAVQGKIAIGSGQLTGKGLFGGTQVQNGLVPAHHTDFIFSVAGEELGFIGASLVVLLLLLLILRVIYNAKTSVTTMGTMICTGVVAMLTFQVFVNILMCIGMFPVIGITLPFFSYGGSSILSSFCAVGLVLSVVVHKKTLQFKYY